MRIKLIHRGILLAAVLLTFVGCKKDDDIILPEPDALFLARPATGNYTIATANTVHLVRVGLTTPSNQTLTYSINVTSPTGAVAGTHYTLSKTTLTFAPGQVLDSFEVRGVYDQYLSGRKDELVITLGGNESTESQLTKTYRLNLSGPCFEGDVDLEDLLGSYRNTMEDFGGAYGPYTTTVSAVNSTSATTGTITVTNIFDAGWNPVTFQLDWTDPNNRIVTLTQQSGIGDAGTISGTYAGDDISVRPHSNGQVGTFSICNQTITIRMQLGVTGLGFFGTMYTLNMAR